MLLRNASSAEVVPFLEQLLQKIAPPGVALAPLDGSDNESEETPLRRTPLQEVRGEETFDDEEGAPFEFRALEAALAFVCAHLEGRSSELEAAAYPALDALTSKISSLNLERVRKLKNGLSRLSARVQKVRDEVEQLLDDDEDMADMFLSRKAASPTSPTPSVGGHAVPPSPNLASRLSRGGSQGTYSTYAEEEEEVEELEQLLEAYFMQVDGTLNRLNTLREYIDDTEDYINIQLDNHRNQLIQLELVLDAGLVTIAISSVVVGIFGMNIPFDWNTDDTVFKWVVVVTATFCGLFFGGLLTYARQRRIIS